MIRRCVRQLDMGQIMLDILHTLILASLYSIYSMLAVFVSVLM